MTKQFLAKANSRSPFDENLQLMLDRHPQIMLYETQCLFHNNKM